MPTSYPTPSPKNSSAELVKKRIQDKSPNRPHWTQIRLSDETEALCAVLDHFNSLHFSDRDRLAKKIDPNHGRLIHQPEHKGGFDAA
ncbi:hypothetical protein [Limnoglobus roseus]|uniref:Uncharacterized protein n=1 Tax=Limnoglobus roseus TaxID=2598579 RepID=A0A5C1ADQ3_9BACT|nr:hypothetical protein [Limnoglobus roseus]QEL16775.1 hypothetical protein PX52LOC_03745 [Limnoglobus roseus]